MGVIPISLGKKSLQVTGENLIEDFSFGRRRVYERELIAVRAADRDMSRWGLVRPILNSDYTHPVGAGK